MKISKRLSAVFLALSALGLSLTVQAANPKEIRISMSSAFIVNRSFF